MYFYTKITNIDLLYYITILRLAIRGSYVIYYIQKVLFQAFNYTPLDVAISLPFNFENVEVIQVLLESGANADHRIYYSNFETNVTYPDTPGPTLLHVVLSRKTDNETEEEVNMLSLVTN